MTDLSDREERSRAGGGEKGGLEDLQSSLEKMGMVGCVSGRQSPWHGPGESGRVEVGPILGMETEKLSKRRDREAGNIPISVQDWKIYILEMGRKKNRPFHAFPF